MVIDMPTVAPALRPAVAGSGAELVVEGCRSVRACVGMHNVIQVHKDKLSIAKNHTENGQTHAGSVLLYIILCCWHLQDL